MPTLTLRSAPSLALAILLALPSPDARGGGGPPVWSDTAVVDTGSLRIDKGPSTVTVAAKGGPVIEYAFAEVPFKPYVRTFHTPAGVNVLRDSPFDHKHHHSLMYAIGVEGVTFWSETEDAGRQVHREFTSVGSGGSDGLATASFIERLDWIAPGDKGLLVTEERGIRIHESSSLGASLLTWSSTLRAAKGKPSVKLGGDHYYGLGARFLVSMDKDGRFLNAEGKEGEVVRGDERLAPGRWCAYTAKADGKLVTLAMFDHPANPKKVLWFTMGVPFAYLSATVNLWKEPMTLEAGKTLRFTYGVAAWDGDADAKKIEALYRRWVAMTKASEKADAKGK